MSVHLRAGMAGYQYAGLSIEDALRRHAEGKRPPAVAVVVSQRHEGELPERVNGLPVSRGNIPAGIVYVVTDLGGRSMGAPAQLLLL